jgi:hypothetical protein
MGQMPFYGSEDEPGKVQWIGDAAVTSQALITARSSTLAVYRDAEYGIAIFTIWVTHMKTTIELPDELINQARRIAKQEGATLRSLVEEGLQRSLDARRQAVHRDLDFPSYGGSGLTDELQGAPWSRIRDEIYRERGA